MSFELYAIAFFASVLMIVLLLMLAGKQNITYYLLLFVTISIGNAGYFVTVTAENLGEAIIGNNMVYIGAVFTSIMVVLCFMKICKLYIPKTVIYGLVLLGFLIMFFVVTAEHNTYYYKSIEYAKQNGMGYLIKEYGPLHIVFYVFLIACMVATTAIIMYTLTKKNVVSYKVITLLALADFATIFCYVLEQIIDTNFDVMPLAYIVDQIIILILIRRINMYEISDNIANLLKEHSTYGYIVFDKKMRYVGCNDMAQVYFPEILNQKVDYCLTKSNTPTLYEYFDEFINNPSSIVTGSESTFEKDEVILKCIIKDFYYGNTKIGYMAEFSDETQHQKYMQLLNNYTENLTEEVRIKSEKISRFQDKLIFSMADMVESRDSNTGGHIKRTSKVINIFTNELVKFKNEFNISIEFLEKVGKAAPMHDLGKIAVEDSILQKPGKFTPEEFEKMKKHSEKGVDIVGKLLDGMDDEEFIRISKNVAHYHHEKWNGQGYPKGLSGEDIPIEARIMALADVFDALVSKRCYKEKMGYDQAFSIIEESSGSHFEPRLAEIFMNCRAQLEEYYDTVEG